MHRPFRFGLQVSFSEPGNEVRELARRAEGAGYDVVTIADHLGFADPFVTAAVAAEATTTVRVGTHVLNIDFHPAALLARACATIDITSNGRFELGLGTGYAKNEYDQARLPFDRAGARVRRVSETVDVLRGLFAGEELTYEGTERGVVAHRLTPLPVQGAGLPILVGGNGDRILEVAATKADVVGFVGFGQDPVLNRPQLTHMTSAGLADRVAHVRSLAADNEHQVLVQRAVIADDAAAQAKVIADDISGMEADAETILDSPFMLVGTVDAICDELQGRREELGVSYFTFFSHRASPEIDQVVGRLAGT